MKTIKLQNNIEIPIIGLGVFKSQDGAETEQAVSWALENGYTHIDTAKIYANEESVGNAIAKSSLPREKIFLTTKLWNEDIKKHRTKDAFQESLKKLQTEYVDLYLIHWPVEGRLEAWADLEELYNAGKIKAIGVSNFQKHHLEELFKQAKIIPLVNQIESHPYFNNQELIDFCHSKNIAVQAWSPLGGDGAPILKNETILSLAEKYNKTPVQIILRWNIQRNVIILPKSVNRDRIISNIQAFDFELTNEDIKAINSLNKNKRNGADPDNFNF